MRMIAPRTGAVVTIAENQEQYQTLTAARYQKDGVSVLLMRWQPDAHERARLAAGEDIYVSLMTFGQPMQPITVQVGPDGWEV